MTFTANYISVPRDLSRVKSKIIFNLTKRQLVCFSLAALIGVPTFFLIRRTGNTSLAALGMMAVMMPLFFIAMFEKNGEPLEVLLTHFIQAQFIRPKIRIYQTENDYAALMRQALAEKEAEAIVQRYHKPVPEKDRNHLHHSGVSESRGQKEDRRDHPECETK